MATPDKARNEGAAPPPAAVTNPTPKASKARTKLTRGLPLPESGNIQRIADASARKTLTPEQRAENKRKLEAHKAKQEKPDTKAAERVVLDAAIREFTANGEKLKDIKFSERTVALAEEARNKGLQISKALVQAENTEGDTYAEFIDAAVCLRHSHESEETRRAWLFREGYRLDKNRPESLGTYLPELKLLFSPDPKVISKYRAKLGQYNKMARGIVEVGGIKPEPGEIRRFLCEEREGKLQGRGQAMKWGSEVPDPYLVPLSDEERKRQQEEDAAARKRNTLVNALVAIADAGDSDLDKLDDAATTIFRVAQKVNPAVGDLNLTDLAFPIVQRLAGLGLLRIGKDRDDFEGRPVTNIERKPSGFVFVAE